MTQVGAFGTCTGALFIDLEQFGVPARGRVFEQKMVWLLEGLCSSNNTLGVEVGAVWATAFQRSDNGSAICENRERLESLFRRYNGVISWCKHVKADVDLIEEVGRQLLSGTLPEVVIIVSGDGDFASLVRRVADSGRKAIVLTPQNKRFSRKLAETGCALRLQKIIKAEIPRRKKIVFLPPGSLPKLEPLKPTRRMRFKTSFEEMVAQWKKENGID